MKTKTLERLPALAAVVLVMLVVAACAIQLRDDEAQTNTSTSADRTSNPLASKLTECRSVTYEQKDALSECRKFWAERRRQFLGPKAPAGSDGEAAKAGSSLFVAPKNEGRQPSDYPSIHQTGRE